MSCAQGMHVLLQMLGRVEGNLIIAVFLGCSYNSRKKLEPLFIVGRNGRMAMELAHPLSVAD